MSAIEVCPNCDIAGCRCIRERNAALSALPSHELLRDALEALEPISALPLTIAKDDADREVVFWLTVEEWKRARTAAEKLRQALTQDQP